MDSYNPASQHRESGVGAQNLPVTVYLLSEAAKCVLNSGRKGIFQGPEYRTKKFENAVERRDLVLLTASDAQTIYGLEDDEFKALLGHEHHEPESDDLFRQIDLPDRHVFVVTRLESTQYEKKPNFTFKLEYELPLRPDIVTFSELNGAQKKLEHLLNGHRSDSLSHTVGEMSGHGEYPDMGR
jgi:hypothetical protein